MHIYYESILILDMYVLFFIQIIMKKFSFLALLWVIVIFGTLAGCGDNKQVNTDEINGTWDFIIEDVTWEADAVVSYNDKLVDLASSCMVSEDAIWNIYDDETSSIEQIQAAISDTVSVCSSVKEQINDLWDWEWDSNLKDGVLTIIEKEIAYYVKFSELLPYLEKEELSEEEKAIYDSLVAEVDSIDKELLEANDNLVSIQEQFAKDHWYELESEIQ